MSNTLYRKYRPQTFSEVVNQEHIKVTLQNELELGRVAHAFLFAGPRGVGKTTLARILAKALNCQHRQGAEPCDQCPSCVEIKEGRSVDIVEIDAASNTGVDHIRELKEQIKYLPIKEKFKVYIIDEVHMLSGAAFNALLKTLEEPPAHAYFILATTDPQEIPETVISRCQRFDFKKVSFEDIVKHLAEVAKQEGVAISETVLKDIARTSEGYLRDALSLLGQILSLGETEISDEEAALVMPRSNWEQVVKFISHNIKGETGPAVNLLNQLVEDGVDLDHFCGNVIETVRKLLLAKVCLNWQEIVWEFGDHQAADLKQLVKDFSEEKIVKMLEIYLEAGQNIKKAHLSQLPLEMAVIKVSLMVLNKTTVETLPPDQTNQSKPSGGVKPIVEAPVSSIKSETQQSNPVQTTEIKKSVKKPVKVDVSFEEVMAKWHEVVEALKSYNHTLASFVTVGRPVDLQENQIVVAFEYDFHHDRVCEKKNLAIIEEVLQRVFKCPLTVIGQVNKSANDFLARSGQSNPDMVKNVLDIFGGEVVS